MICFSFLKCMLCGVVSCLKMSLLVVLVFITVTRWGWARDTLKQDVKVLSSICYYFIVMGWADLVARGISMLYGKIVLGEEFRKHGTGWKLQHSITLVYSPVVL